MLIFAVNPGGCAAMAYISTTESRPEIPSEAFGPDTAICLRNVIIRKVESQGFDPHARLAF
jgi:hypothetical protein